MWRKSVTHHFLKFQKNHFCHPESGRNATLGKTERVTWVESLLSNKNRENFHIFYAHSFHIKTLHLQFRVNSKDQFSDSVKWMLAERVGTASLFREFQC